MSSNPTPSQQLIDEARGLLNDTNTSARDVPDEVWDSAVANALRDLTRWSPLRKVTSLHIPAGSVSAALPTDFIDIDMESFNRAVDPRGRAFSYRDFIFALDSTTDAASDIWAFGSAAAGPFERRTVFEFVDDGAGGKLMTFVPASLADADISFVYLALHQVDDSLNTVPAGQRDLLVLKVCEHACRALARLLAGNPLLHPQYRSLAGDFLSQFESRSRFRPNGLAG